MFKWLFRFIALAFVGYVWFIIGTIHYIDNEYEPQTFHDSNLPAGHVGPTTVHTNTEPTNTSLAEFGQWNGGEN